VLPLGVELPNRAARQVERFKASGGKIIRDAESIDSHDLSSIVSGAGDRVVVGRFTRRGREILLIVNVGSETVEAAVNAPRAEQWLKADPGTGRIETPKIKGQNKITVSLTPRSAMLFIGPQAQTGIE